MASEKRILIIGASDGIGAATAGVLDRQGCELILVARSTDKLIKVNDGLLGDHKIFSYDLIQLDSIETIFQFACADGKQLSGMVFCAGTAPLCRLRDNSVALMRQVFDVNYFSFVELVKCYQMDRYSRKDSSIVAVSSIAANASGNRQVLYGSSKAALNASVKLMARELLLRGIRINTVMPGATETAMLDSLRNENANLDALVQRNQPLGILTPEAVAELVEYLLSERAKYMTGLNIPVDGGALL